VGTGIFLNYVGGGNTRFTIEDNRNCEYNLGGGVYTQTLTYSPTTLSTNIIYILISYRRGSTGFSRLIGNGTLAAVTTQFTTNLTILSNLSTLRMGGYDAPFNNNTGPLLSGSIYEHILFRYALTDSQIFEIEGYLAWRWGLQTALPTTHPYYRVRP
jgi:hypothetical protein